MLKTTVLLERLTSEKLNVDNGKVNGFDIGDNNVEYAKKSGKLSKSRKKLSKSGNSTNFEAKKAKPSFLTSSTRKAFNRLRLAFTKAPIF